jgi:DNA-damage-inducible protein D
MYNMSLRDLTRRKGIPEGQKLLDRMGKTELAANLFRVTQTDEKIKNENLAGQSQLENAAYTVGKTVRDTMQRLSGKTPESLPIAPPIQAVKRTLKDTGKRLRALGSSKASGPRLPMATIDASGCSVSDDSEE